MDNLNAYYLEHTEVIDQFFILLINSDYEIGLKSVLGLESISPKLKLYISNFLLANLTDDKIVKLVREVLIQFS